MLNTQCKMYPTPVLFKDLPIGSKFLWLDNLSVVLMKTQTVEDDIKQQKNAAILNGICRGAHRYFPDYTQVIQMVD